MFFLSWGVPHCAACQNKRPYERHNTTDNHFPRAGRIRNLRSVTAASLSVFDFPPLISTALRPLFPLPYVQSKNCFSASGEAFDVSRKLGGGGENKGKQNTKEQKEKK